MLLFVCLVDFFVCFLFAASWYDMLFGFQHVPKECSNPNTFVTKKCSCFGLYHYHITYTYCLHCENVRRTKKKEMEQAEQTGY